MKKYLFLALALSACTTAKPYKCQPLTFVNKVYWGEVRVANADIEYILANGYNDKTFNDFMQYAMENFEDSKICYVINNEFNQDISPKGTTTSA